MKIESDAWVAYGTMLFADRWDYKLWKEGKIPRPKPVFRYWCPACESAFEPFTTPTKCPSCGVKASSLPEDQRVMLTHKTHTAATFPFYTIQKPTKAG